MFEFISISVFSALTYYWLKSRDPNIEKLQKVFETNNLKAGDQIPMFSKKRGNVYLYRLPTGLSFDAIKSKEQAFKDAFPDKAVDISFKHALRIVIADPLPEEMMLPEVNERGWCIPIGQAIERTIYHDFAKYPHLLVSGMTRYGKTVFLKLIICSLVMMRPAKTEFALIDLKGGLAFNSFRYLRQTRYFAKDVESALSVLKSIKKEAETRQEFFLDLGFEKYEEAQHVFNRLFVIIDEAAELTSHGLRGKDARPYQECERLLSHIARIGAGLGIHLIYCTQYPTAQTLPQQVKQNCDATLSFRLRNSTASRVVFDETGKAEDLPHIRGRAIYRTDRDVEIQVFNLNEEMVSGILEGNLRWEGGSDGSAANEATEAGGDTVIFR